MSIQLGDDIIDSRDIIKRMEELESEVDDLETELEDLTNEHDNLEAIQDEIAQLQDEIGDRESELDAWRLFEQAGVADWQHGEQFINEDYFEQYIVDLVTDCYEFPKEFGSGDWPWAYLEMDWEAAAEAAKMDYTEVLAALDHTYLARA